VVVAGGGDARQHFRNSCEFRCHHRRCQRPARPRRGGSARYRADPLYRDRVPMEKLMPFSC